MNKKGIELSANFLIIIIMSIVIFAGGIFLAQKLFAGAGDVLDDLDQQSQDRIEQLLDDGARVAMPFKAMDVPPEESVVFGVGILNVIKPVAPAVTVDFFINLAFEKAYKNDAGQTEIVAFPDGMDPVNWFIFDAGPHPLKLNEKKVYRLYVKPPAGATAGTYIYNVNVDYNAVGTSYEPTRKIMVRVV